MKQKLILFQPTDKFNKPNILINIVTSDLLSLKEKKLYNNLLRRLINQSIENYQTNTIKTTITDLMRELNTTERKDIPEMLEKFRKVGIRFNHIIDNKKVKWTCGLIAGYGTEHKNTDSTYIEFSHHLTNEILKYWNLYTNLDIDQMNNLKMGHSLTLYEYFKSSICKFPNQKKNITKTEIFEKLNLTKSYEDTKVLTRLLKELIKDINVNTSLNVEYLGWEKPKKTNDLKDMTYKFYVEQGIDWEYLVWVDTIKYFAIEMNMNIVFKRTKTYEIYITKDLEEKRPQPLLVRQNITDYSKPPKTLNFQEMEKNYQEQFKIFKSNTKKYLENHSIELEDFEKEYQQTKQSRTDFNKYLNEEKEVIEYITN